VPSLNGVRILLAEDNEINQQIAVEILRDAGATVEVVGDGMRAVAAVLERPEDFDVVLTDLQMPEMDGYEAAQSIREVIDAETLPIIAMTAHASEEERQKCLGIGMNDHVSKPIDPAHLIATVARWTSRKLTDAGMVLSPPSAKSTALNLPDRLPGLDVAQGVARIGGNTALYVKLLRSFLDARGGTIEEFDGFLAEGNLEAATRLAHSVKGISGNLAATELHLAAADLETALRTTPVPNIDVMRKQFAGALACALASAKSLVQGAA
jgi:CheY-like chemotaxis protein/HPt (histidine-containing phosphotransfer) domain-containing protein